MNLLGMEVRIFPYLEPGKAMLVKSDAGWSDILFFRTESEWLLSMSGATWHVNGHCPTWTDDECRCMLGGEA